MFSFTTNLPFEEVVDFYHSGLIDSGWELSSETTQDNTYFRYYMKGETRMVMVSINEEESWRRVAIMVVDQP